MSQNRNLTTSICPKASTLDLSPGEAYSFHPVKVLQRLKNTSRVIPSDNEDRYFRYTHEETGHCSNSMIYSAMVEDYLSHRKANGLPIPEDYLSVIDDQMCQQIDPDYCSFSVRRPTGNGMAARFSVQDVKDAMKVFTAWALRGFRPVEQAEANRRARICANCFYNLNAPGCAGCARLYSLLSGMFSKLSTPLDQRLKVCAVCRCLNRAQVWVPLNVLDEKDSPEKQEAYPSFCWLKHA